MATKKLVTSQFMVTLVQYLGPDADVSTATDLEEALANGLGNEDGTVMVHQVGKTKTLVQGAA